ncbi:S8 family peptidase [Flexithrix dorotheae]|uniref:S8 family peptidase n=1 Tax=Flexithrix dorotheae TaxID=70993 RepID=UPI001FE071B0|nr:S8 family peptidase [Flexithrix dorotheae]
MIKSKRHFVIAFTLLITTTFSFANETIPNITDPGDSLKSAPENWFNLDPTADKIRGVGTERAYKELLKGKKSKKVVVAVIDSGIDIDHEDLKDVIWKNDGEVAGNGKDDDGNGYVDDVHGWNFIGGKDGENVDADTYELTREYVRLNKKYKDVDPASLSKKEKVEFAYYEKVKKEYEESAKSAQEDYNYIVNFYESFKYADRLIKAYLNTEDLKAEDLSKINSTDERITQSKSLLELTIANNLTEEVFNEQLDYLTDQVEFGYNPDFNSREIIGDNYEDKSEKIYGNNDVTGPDATHGTHVAGIIAANRNNDIGIKGIADNVEIMVIRAVPNGDERDKDVANAIRYAVDNGAQVINMSFGKSYSPYKEVVDEAVKYAESKGVLLVHAAGNDAKNLDENTNFPTKTFKGSKKAAKNWLEIGALSWGDESNFVGSFSNYGKKSVDIFSPGVDIYSTVPGSKYQAQNGTSMAAPVAAGTAALIMSYYPDLSAVTVKDIILKSSVKFGDLMVNKPNEEGEDTKIKFSELSSTGGIVNVYEALKMAESMSIKNKKR